MNRDQFASLIRGRGMAAVTDAIQGGSIIAAALGDGLNLTDWHMQQTGGAVLFVRTEATDEPAPILPRIPSGRDLGNSEQMARRPVEGVLVVNAPESDRATWEQIAASSGAEYPVLVLMAPGGVFA